jgi:hypothetical protein
MNVRLMLRIAVCGIFLFATPLMTKSHAAESGEFKGTWIANGTRALFTFGVGRQVYTFKIGGHVSLKTTLHNKKDYWSECVGLSDSVTGVTGRCVWKDLAGPEIYLTLQSSNLQQGGLVTSTIVGGSGPLAGISGDLSFNWSSVIFQRDAEGIENVSGQALNLSGRYQVP